jgi:hypothetical protein
MIPDASVRCDLTPEVIQIEAEIANDQRHLLKQTSGQLKDLA